MKLEAPLSSEIALQAARIVQRGLVWVSAGGACVKPGPPVCGLLWACVKPGPPVPVSWRLIWGVLVKRGWSGFRWGRAGCAAGVVWVSVGARVETWAAPVWVVVGVRETRASRACSMAPDMGSFGEAGVVWVSLGACGVCSRGGLGFTWGGVCETWAAPVWVVVGVCETWAARAL